MVSGMSKVFYILGYNYKNFRLKVSHNWFLKRGTYCILTSALSVAIFCNWWQAKRFCLVRFPGNQEAIWEKKIFIPSVNLYGKK